VFRSSRFTAFFAVLISTAVATRADARRAAKPAGKPAAFAKSSGKTAGKAAKPSAKSAVKASSKAAAKPPATAAKPTAADPRPAEARKACAAGKVDRGIQILAEIIVENGDANAVYNQARCYQQNGRPEQAVARFREYLRTAAQLAPADRTQVEGYIVELEAEIETKARRAALPATAATGAPAGSAATAASEEPAPPPAAPAPTMVQPVPESVEPSGAESTGGQSLAESATSPPASASPSNLRRTAAIAAASVGVASIAAGAYFGWKTAQVSREIENNRGPLQFAELERMMARGRQNAGLQWAGYGVGIAALAGAAALVYWDHGAGPSQEIAGRSETPSRGQFIILPTVQPSAAGGVASGAVVQSTF
jgi:hypothetical protein